MWKRISTKRLLNHPRLRVVEDEVSLPDGERAGYLRFENYPNSVLLVCQDNYGHVLLQREYAYPLNQEAYQLPGGHAHSREGIEDTARRELVEESGYFPGTLELLGSYYTNLRRTDAKTFIYLATNLEERAVPGNQEERYITNSWVGEAAFEKLIIDGKLLNPDCIAAWTLYKLRSAKRST